MLLRVLAGFGMIGFGLLMFAGGILALLNEIGGAGGKGAGKVIAFGLVIGPAFCYWGYKAFLGQWD